MSIWYQSFPEGAFPQTNVLLFVDVSTAILKLMEKLVKRVKKLLKTLFYKNISFMSTIYRSIYTIKNHNYHFGMVDVA